MRNRMIIAAIACLGAAPVSAQPAPDQERRPADIPADPAKCAPGGHAAPIIAYGGSPYELAGPCSPKIVRDAAEAVGMGRARPIGIKSIITFRFTAEGTLADAAGKLDKISSLKAHISYVIPAMRLQLEGARVGGKAFKEVQVFSESKAWNEQTPGVGASAAPAGAAALRAPLVKLTPVGALLSIVEAEGTVKIETVAGKVTLTGASPYDNIPVTVTLGEKNLPERVVVTSGGRRYEATFSDYKEEAPPYMVVFPAHMTWTLDGKPLADLKVTEFRSNPYVIFPVPAVAR